MTTKTAVLSVYKDVAGQFRWTLQASNGATIADCAEGYSTKYGAKRAARRFLQIVSGPVSVTDLTD